MAHTTTTPAADSAPRSSHRLHWVTYAVAAWSFAYGLLALGWTITGRGYPLGENDPDGALSMLDNVPADVGAPLFAATALAGAGMAFLMARWPSPAQAASVGRAARRHNRADLARSQLRAWWRVTLIVIGTLTALGWLLVVPDGRVLAIVGYLPMVLVAAPFDAELRESFMEALGPIYLNHLAVLVGGFLWAVATVVFARRTSGACVSCGRGMRRRRWTHPAAAARWGGWAVGIAVAIPAIYAVTRWVWVAGYPLGIDSEVFADGSADGSLWGGAWLGTFALVGAALTIGLVRPWGEVFPRWVIGLRGRPVPIKAAVIPASFVSVVVVSAGMSLIKIGFEDDSLALSADDWAAIGPALLWPLWGVALAAATYAYYLRRRGGCDTCGRSDGEHPPAAFTEGSGAAEHPHEHPQRQDGADGQQVVSDQLEETDRISHGRTTVGAE